jgi:hypothetical protein
MIVAVPDYKSLMLPVLRAVADGEPVTTRALREAVAEQLGLSADELAETIPSGREPVFANRVGWATTYLVQAGLLVRPKRAVVTITERGRDVLRENPEAVVIYAGYGQTKGELERRVERLGLARQVLLPGRLTSGPILLFLPRPNGLAAMETLSAVFLLMPVILIGETGSFLCLTSHPPGIMD